MELGEYGANLELLEADLHETENSIYHLVRSNVELSQFLDENDADADLEQALEENKLVLVKKRHRVLALKKAISNMRKGQCLEAGSLPSAATQLPVVGMEAVQTARSGLQESERSGEPQATERSSDARVGDVVRHFASSTNLDAAQSPLSTVNSETTITETQPSEESCHSTSPVVAIPNSTASERHQGAGGGGAGRVVDEGVLL